MASLEFDVIEDKTILLKLKDEYFQTKRSVFSRFKNSFLYALVNGSLAESCYDSTTPICVERDPTAFWVILCIYKYGYSKRRVRKMLKLKMFEDVKLGKAFYDDTDFYCLNRVHNALKFCSICSVVNLKNEKHVCHGGSRCEFCGVEIRRNENPYEHACEKSFVYDGICFASATVKVGVNLNLLKTLFDWMKVSIPKRVSDFSAFKSEIFNVSKNDCFLLNSRVITIRANDESLHLHNPYSGSADWCLTRLNKVKVTRGDQFGKQDNSLVLTIWFCKSIEDSAVICKCYQFNNLDQFNEFMTLVTAVVFKGISTFIAEGLHQMSSNLNENSEDKSIPDSMVHNFSLSAPNSAKILYIASRDGFSIKILFQQVYYAMGNFSINMDVSSYDRILKTKKLLYIIKTEDGFVFGVFVSKCLSFIFTLINPNGVSPLKITISTEIKSNRDVYPNFGPFIANTDHFSYLCPRFSDSSVRFGHFLMIRENFNYRGGYCFNFEDITLHTGVAVIDGHEPPYNIGSGLFSNKKLKSRVASGRTKFKDINQDIKWENRNFSNYSPYEFNERRNLGKIVDLIVLEVGENLI